MPTEAARLAALRDRLETGILTAVPNTDVNGARDTRVPNTTNISFDRIEAESLLIALDLEGVAVSTGSACSSGTLEPSHVLKAMNLPTHRAQNSIRFSLGAGNTEEQIDHVIAILPRIVGKLRSLVCGRIPSATVMRIVVAMSGGVDSSVAAALLAERATTSSACRCSSTISAKAEHGYGSCCSLDDLHDAGRVARRLNIPHYIVNFEREFQRTVVANFVDEYVAGRTPIPCAHCNSDLKFATLLDRAHGFGAEIVATGHYARVETDPSTGRRVLRRGLDAGKDQSYFLFSLTQEQLARASFPVGDLTKDDVREFARVARPGVADKPDSQEICFVPDGDYAASSSGRPARRTPRARS